jgi:proteasome lid subunit RPN8/RPN11
MSSKTIKVKVKTHPVLVMEAEVARKIRQHSRTSMKAEVCGVLIGSTEDERTLVEACIAGVNAAQGGAHVTFTQDTWEHIYKIKDEQFPEKKIVGWYHSHPGFGVFLSEHDLFIQENFFSSPQQVAWVYDPHTDEEGCFGWVSGKIEKLNGVRFGYSQAVDMSGSAGSDYDDDDETPSDPVLRIEDKRSEDRDPAWAKWVNRALLFIAIVGLGFIAGRWFTAYQVAPQLELLDQIQRHPIEACQQIVQGILAGTRDRSSAPTQTQQPEPAAPAKPQRILPPVKEPNGQH